MHGGLQVVKGVVHCYFCCFPWNLRLFFKFLNCIPHLGQVGVSSHARSLGLLKHFGWASVGLVRWFKLDLVVTSLLLAAAAVLGLLFTGFTVLVGLNMLNYFDPSLLWGRPATTPGPFFRRCSDLLDNLVEERGLSYIRWVFFLEKGFNHIDNFFHV